MIPVFGPIDTGRMLLACDALADLPAPPIGTLILVQLDGLDVWSTRVKDEVVR